MPQSDGGRVVHADQEQLLLIAHHDRPRRFLIFPEYPGAGGQVDGFMMDTVTKVVGSDPEIHVQCFGPPEVSVINTILVALPAALTIQQ